MNPFGMTSNTPTTVSIVFLGILGTVDQPLTQAALQGPRFLSGLELRKISPKGCHTPSSANFKCISCTFQGPRAKPRGAAGPSL